MSTTTAFAPSTWRWIILGLIYCASIPAALFSIEFAIAGIGLASEAALLSETPSLTQSGLILFAPLAFFAWIRFLRSSWAWTTGEPAPSRGPALHAACALACLGPLGLLALIFALPPLFLIAFAHSRPNPEAASRDELGMEKPLLDESGIVEEIIEA